jgi:hypothetical protein
MNGEDVLWMNSSDFGFWIADFGLKDIKTQNTTCQEPPSAIEGFGVRNSE